MSQLVSITTACYKWHQFTLQGKYVANEYGFSHWIYPEGFKRWIEVALRGRVAYMRADSRIPIFIEDTRDAIVFRLVWDHCL